ncbi:MAG: FUN14 domain-containing protein [Candidatus Bathyarchaeia archaeon]
MIESLTLLLPQVAQLSAGGVGGFLAGYAIKKIVKIILVFLGIGFLSLIYLSQKDIISINYEKLIDGISTALTEAPSFFSTTIALVPFTSSFAAGFTIGIWKG